MSILLFFLSFVAVSIEAQELTAARYASADLNADGRVEMILGGRFGPFTSSGGRGVLQIGEVQGTHIRVVSDAGDLPVVRDVAIGDLGQDGRLEVFAVGDGWLKTFAYEDQRLVPLVERRLATDWTDRVAVMTVAGQTLVVVTEYTVRPDRDSGTTRLRGFRAGGGLFEEAWTVSVDTHVGDVALVASDPDLMVIETGTGDEGGDFLVYELRDAPTPIWRGRLTDGRRCLTVEAAPEARIAVHAVGDETRLFSVGPRGIRLWQRATVVHGSALVPVLNPDGAVGGIGRVTVGAGRAFHPLFD